MFKNLRLNQTHKKSFYITFSMTYATVYYFNMIFVFGKKQTKPYQSNKNKNNFS